VFRLLRVRKAWRCIPDAVAVARSLDSAIDEAWARHHAAWTATTALSDAHARSGVRAATPELSSLVEALRTADGADADALRGCRNLLSDGFSSPLYAGDAEDLRREARRLRFRVLAGPARG
jgi:hypothetical protein